MILAEITDHTEAHPEWLTVFKEINAPPLTLLSVVIPARNEEGCIESTVEHLHVELRLRGIPHEIIVVDDGSTDATYARLEAATSRVSTLRVVRNLGPHGFGRAIVRDSMRSGDAVVVVIG